MHWSKLNRDVDIPKLDCDDCDVDLDELDFDVLPWLTNFSELEIKEDPDRDHAMSAMSTIYSNETNNNDCENGDKSWVEANQRKKQFQCDVCLKNLSTKFGLKIHKRTHTGEKPYSCELYGKRFAQSSNLNIHKGIHSEEKPYGCDLCEKRYLYSSCLKIHMKNHH